MSEPKQLRQPIEPTHLIGSTGTEPGSELGYFSADLLTKGAFSLSVNEENPITANLFFDSVVTSDIDFDGAWRIMSDAQGSLELDIQVSDFGQEPSSVDSILDGNFITLSDANVATGDMTGWLETGIDKNKIVRIVVVSSNETITGFTLVVDTKRRMALESSS